MSPALSRRAFLTGLAALALARAEGARAALFPPEGAWEFALLGREGEPVGAQSFRFARAADRFTVAVELEWRLPAASGRHRALETWRGGWLHAIESRSRIGGEDHELRAERNDDALRGRRDGHAFSVSGYLVPDSLWHPETPRLGSLLDSVSGRLRPIRGRRGPTEAVPADGGEVEATYWLVTAEPDGSLWRELWYDAAGRLARARFAATEGTPLVLERRRTG